MEDLFKGIQWLFEDVILLPFHALADLELDSWWLANIMSWLFMIVGFVAFLYWMKQLRIFNDNNEERKDVSAHSFL